MVLLLNVSIITHLSIEFLLYATTYLVLFRYWYNSPEDLVQVFSVPFNVRYYWVNSLNIAINRIPKYGDMSGTTECPNL